MAGSRIGTMNPSTPSSMRSSAPVLVDGSVLAALDELAELAPLHNPAAVGAMRRLEGLGVPQVACFDTAFHRSAPEIAQAFALPFALHDEGIRRYVTTLAALGAVVSAYHVLLERAPSLESGACDVANPCTIIWVRRFGYLTIPTMALSAFALILSLMLTRARQPERPVQLEGGSDGDDQVASVLTARRGR